MTHDDEKTPVHTPTDEGHPGLHDEHEGRSDRDLGGPSTSDESREEDVTGRPGAHGDIETKGFDSHE